MTSGFLCIVLGFISSTAVFLEISVLDFVSTIGALTSLTAGFLIPVIYRIKEASSKEGKTMYKEQDDPFELENSNKETNLFKNENPGIFSLKRFF